jgi:ribonuclease HI
VIATDSLSTIMAAEGTRRTKNPKTRRRVKLMWITSHSGITGNEKADEAVKNALEEDINDQELYPPQDLIKLMKKTDAKNRQERWTQGETP